MPSLGSKDPTVDLAQRADSTSRPYRWFNMVEAVALVLLGIAAIAVPAIATLAFEAFFGWLLLLRGIIGAVTTLSNRRSAAVIWSWVSAIAAITAGLMLLRWPLAGAVSLTMILILFFILEGFASIMFAMAHRRDQSANWQWIFVSGAIDLILAALILTGLPGASIWAIGLLLGINLIFGGSALLAMAARGQESALRAGTRAS